MAQDRKDITSSQVDPTGVEGTIRSKPIVVEKVRRNIIGDVENASGATLGDILGAALRKRSEKPLSESTKSDFKWKPIEPLSEKDRNIDLASTRPLYDAWRVSKDRIRKSRPEALKEFNDRLIRRMSIETGNFRKNL